MEMFLVVLALVGVGWLVMAVLVCRAMRAVRRRVHGARDQARLLARAYGVGPAAEAARLRRQLVRNLAGARRALVAAREVDSPVGDVPSLLARLELAAQAVDGELRVLEADADRVRIGLGLAGPRSRVEAISASSARLVEGLLAAAGHRGEELSLLQAACAIEADALRSAGQVRRPAQQWETSTRLR